MSQLPNFDHFENCQEELINLLRNNVKNLKNLTFIDKSYYIKFMDQYFYFREGAPTFGSTVVITVPVHSDWNCSCIRCRTHTAIREVEKVHHVYLTNCSPAEHK